MKSTILVTNTNMVLNVAKSFIRRVYTLSHAKFHVENTVAIKTILGKNNFPQKTIDDLIHQVKNNPQRNSTQRNSTLAEQTYPFLNYTVPTSSPIGNNNSPPMANSTMINAPSTNKTTKKKYAGLTYIPDLSEKLTKQLKRYAPELGIAPRPPDKVLKLFTSNTT